MINVKICLKGTIHSPGAPEYQDSTQAKLAGFYGIAVAMYAINQLFLEMKGSFTTGCDSELEMKKLLISTRLRSKSTHFDLAHSIRCLMKQTQVK